MEKNYDISRLFDFYGAVLTERQRLAVNFYYNDDLSLSEVAEELGISRQGVRASLRRSEEILRELESKLGLVKRFEASIQNFENIRAVAASAKKQSVKEKNERLGLFAEKILKITNTIEQEMELGEYT